MVEHVLVNDPAHDETVVAEGVSFENFLKFFAEHHAEWLVGKVILIVSNNAQHQAILMFLGTLLNLYLSLRSLGRVLPAGLPMWLSAQQPAREPDLLVVLNDNLGRIKETFLDGPADIAVEIISPESDKRDRGEKFVEYEAGGVKEYWLFDPIRQQAIVYALREDGRYHQVPLDSEGNLVSLLLPGFVFSPALLWRESPPEGSEMSELVRQMAG